MYYKNGRGFITPAINFLLGHSLYLLLYSYRIQENRIYRAIFHKYVYNGKDNKDF
jgi:hypothetical protein